jgi:hypothetical protein
MKAKGNTKRAVKPNFWKGYEEQVSNELKEMIYDQYLSYHTLSIYCDATRKMDCREQAIACSYIHNASVVVKQKFVHLPYDCINKNVYGELESVIFALKHFTKYMMPYSKNVIIYSDVASIKHFINNEKTFKNPSLRKVQSELILLYQKVKKQNLNITIEIEYLPLEHKKYNPFYCASDNAAYGMMHRK